MGSNPCQLRMTWRKLGFWCIGSSQISEDFSVTLIVWSASRTHDDGLVQLFFLQCRFAENHDCFPFLCEYIFREKIRYLEEGGEETADIQAKYPREPPEIAPPQFTKEQVHIYIVKMKIIKKKIALLNLNILSLHTMRASWKILRKPNAKMSITCCSENK